MCLSIMWTTYLLVTLFWHADLCLLTLTGGQQETRIFCLFKMGSELYYALLLVT